MVGESKGGRRRERGGRDGREGRGGREGEGGRRGRERGMDRGVRVGRGRE